VQIESIRSAPHILNMQGLSQPFVSAVLITAGLTLTVLLLVLLGRWARRRSRGAVVAGALLSLFAPDPELERSIRLAEEARQIRKEEDEEGEDKEPLPGGLTSS
jgi:hypothetical protein